LFVFILSPLVVLPLLLTATVAADDLPDSTAKVPAGFRARVVATEPLIQDAVAFTVDPDGHVLVAETERTNHGAMDNRSSPWHLEDDLQALTVEDRIAYMEKWAHKRSNGMDFYTEASDRVRRTIDTDGDGIYDAFTIFAGPFNEVPDGIGAGVLTVDDEVWYTNIPHLWRLVDGDGDGVAETREPIQSGFGVRFALYGHDMHGLTLGPDGRVYWSIGDRGYHLVTDDGRVLADPRAGAVFRCERDGSNLEVFATGLRNPQELGFNWRGDLFTGDNTSDAGDRARIVFVAEGGETGWTMDYQSLEGANLRGPWEQERIWEVVTERNEAFRPDWTLPPLAHVGAGPSGFAYDPGLGLPADLADHFFMCDFTGSAPNSKVWAFQCVPDGAGYEVVNPRPFATGMLNTDVDFDWNGRMLVSEWGGGWSSTKRGRLHAIEHAEAASDPRIAEARDLAIAGMASLDEFTLADLLSHPARRLRLMAQVELAERKAIDTLADVARYETETVPRIHALWGLGHVARLEAARNRRIDAAMQPVLVALADPDAEVRAQAAKVLGDPAYAPATEALVTALADESSRVRFQAALTLGAIGDASVTPYLAAMLAENADRDRFLRHAGVLALVRIGDRAAIEEMASSPAPALRRAAVLAMRRLADPAIERLLYDDDVRIRTEAARAVHDVPIPEAMPALAAIASEYAPVDSAADDDGIRVTREIFRIEKDRGDANLLELAAFDREPDVVETVPVFEGLVNGGDRYLTRLTARLVAPQTGSYRFSIASDDGSVLRISTSGEIADLEPVARVQGWVGARQWNTQAGQTSRPINLVAGQEILVEARHAEGGGGDHVAVAWELPDGRFEGPIGAKSDLHPSEIPLLRRVVDANVRGGTPANIEALAGIAMNPMLPGVIRDEAIRAIATFDAPGPRDRVLGWWRPASDGPRDLESLRPALARTLPILAEDDFGSVRTLARETAGRLGVALDPEMLRTTVLDSTAPPTDRAACLRQLVRLRDAELPAAIDATLTAEDAGLRAAGRDALADIDVDLGIAAYDAALADGEIIERQQAILGLARLDDDRAIERLTTQLEFAFDQQKVAVPWAVELLEAAERCGDDDLATFAQNWRARSVEDPAVWLVSLEGGDAAAGARVARFHTSASCLRCHVIDGRGGDAGPVLDGVGARSDRATILQSVVDPQAVVVEGYGEASAMPNMRQMLTPREVRDLVAYLASLTEAPKAGGH
jgi:HEAT repeat protein/glucose/arabinose dehydrogenase/mono/diheme cytochrome c family protein